MAETFFDFKKTERLSNPDFKYIRLPEINGIPTRESVEKWLSQYNITLLSYERRKDKLYAWMESDHWIGDTWWEDIVGQIFPGCYSTTGSTCSYPEKGREVKFKLRLL